MCTVDVLPGKPGFSFATQGSPTCLGVLHSMQPSLGSGFPHAQRNPRRHPAGQPETSLRLSPLFASLHGGQTFLTPKV